MLHTKGFMNTLKYLFTLFLILYVSCIIDPYVSLYDATVEWSFFSIHDSTTLNISNVEMVINSEGGYSYFVDLEPSFFENTYSTRVEFKNIHASKLSELKKDNISYELSVSFDSISNAWDSVFYVNDMGFTKDVNDHAYIDVYINIDSLGRN